MRFARAPRSVYQLSPRIAAPISGSNRWNRSSASDTSRFWPDLSPASGGKLPAGCRRRCRARAVGAQACPSPAARREAPGGDLRRMRAVGRPGRDMLGAQTERQGATAMASAFGDARGRHGQVDAPRQVERAPAFADPARQEVHRRRAREARDELRRRPVIDAVGRVVLDHVPRLQDDDAIGERHRLDLVVRDVHDGVAELLVELLDLDPHLGAQERVEVRQRFVEQKRLRLAHDRPSHRDALALTA